MALWKNAIAGADSTLCTIHNSENKLLGGFAVHHWPVRTLPGHRILRVENFGESIPPGAEGPVVRAILALAKKRHRVLRIDIELFERNEERRTQISSAIAKNGFDHLNEVRTYRETLVLDLRRDDVTLLSSFSARARRQIRRTRQYPIRVFSITDDHMIPQLELIKRETYERTGGIAPNFSWSRLIAAARSSPNRIRIFGAFYGAQESAQQLIAYAVVLRNGTFAQYYSAGSTRLADSKVPLMYPVIWEILQWARDGGSTWFDFGGITDGSSKNENDALGGISEFKRNFGGISQPICENWRLVLAPTRQYFATLAGKLVS
jgi:hypothetical protein